MVKIISKLGNDILPMFFLGLVACLFFYKTIFLGLMPVPTDVLVGRYHPWKDVLIETFPRGYPYKNPLISDSFRQQMVWRKEVVDAWKNGQKPGWDPSEFGGSPLDVNIQSGAYYPLNVIFLWLPFDAAWTALILFPVFGLLFFSYLFMRSIKLLPLAALFGAIIVGFSGFTISWLTWGTIISAYMWLPLLLLGVQKLICSKSWLITGLWFFIMIVAAINTITAGHIQIAIYVMATTVVYWIVEARRNSKSYIPLLLFLIVLGIIFNRFALHFMQYVITSVRANSTMWHQQGFFLPFRHFIQFLAPDYFGNPSTMNYFGTWNYGELTGYIGIIGLILSSAGIIVKNDKKNFWLGLLIVSLAFATNNPIAWLPYALHFPFIDSLQPTRLMMLVDFCLAVLAAIGYNTLLKRFSATRRLIAYIAASTVGLIVLSLFWTSIRIVFAHNTLAAISLRNTILPLLIAGAILLATKVLPSKRYMLAWCFIGLLTVDLFRFGWKFTPFSPKEFLYPQSKIITFLQSQPGPFRVLALDIETAPPNSLGWYGIETMSGYNPIYTQRYAQFFQVFQNGIVGSKKPSFQRLFDITNFMSPVARIANVQYALTVDLVATASGTVVMKEGDTFLITRDTLPRWYFADRVETFSDEGEVLSAITHDSLDGHPAFIESYFGDVPNSTGEVETITYEPNKQILKTNNVANGFLVNGTAWDAHWHAYIDGAETPIFHTNYLFMGILVLPGEHMIQFVYE